MAINKDELNELIEQAGLGKRSAKKLHEANDTRDAEEARTSRGHGAPRRPSVELDEL